MFRYDLRKIAVLTWALLAVAPSALLAAEGDEGSKKLMAIIPASTNAIVVVDVRAALQSAFAQAWGWTADGGTTAKGFTNPFARFKDVDRFVAAARMNYATMDTSWETAVLQRSDPKQAMPGVVVDKVGGKPTNRGLSGLLLIDLGDGVVAAIHDADRQLAAQWVEQGSAGKASEYLQQAAGRASAATPIVVAYDLKDAVGLPDAMHMIMGDPPEALANVSEEDAAALAKLFASVRGVTLTISADKEPRGEAIVNFGEDASKLGDKAKPVLLELLGRQGMAITDFKNWDFKVSGDRVVASGGFSTGGVKRVLNAIRTPGQSSAVASSAQGKTPPDAKADPSDKSAASRKYYATISEMIDSLKPAKELGETAAWLVRDAKRIDALPILGVDPELIAWGSQVSMTLRDLAGIQASGQRQVRAQTGSFNAPNAYYYGGEDTDTRASIQTRSDWNNYQRQRRQAADSVKVGITEQSTRVIQDLLKSRNDIRGAMTEKYSAEF